MTGIPENRKPPAAAAVFVLKGEDKVNLANAVAEEQLGVGLGVPKLAILEGKKDEMTLTSVACHVFDCFVRVRRG